MTKSISIKVALLVASAIVASACFGVDAKPNPGFPKNLVVDTSESAEDFDNKLFSYDPSVIKRSDIVPWPTRNTIRETEREALEGADDDRIHSVAIESIANIRQSAGQNKEKINAIASNSREVRLLGTERKEVEMKDDMATRIMVALENLQAEAKDVWGEVNGELDKGWTKFKSMVEEALAPNGKKATLSPSVSRQLREAYNSGKMTSLVTVGESDGYSLIDENTSKSPAESTGAKIKDFLSSIGLNETNQKKASEALSKAGSTVSETVTKDIPNAFNNLPDTMKKAGDAVSETVTKDIPNAFKDLPDTLKKAGDAVSETMTKDLPNAFKNFFG